jgi:membrane protein DedA with SNARE-associated domain
MKSSRASNWSKLKVFFGAMLLALLALGGLLAYASLLAGRQNGQSQSSLLILGAELIVLSVVAAVLAVVLKKRLTQDD